MNLALETKAKLLVIATDTGLKVRIASALRQGLADLPLAPLFGILLVSNLANNVVPARIGDERSSVAEQLALRHPEFRRQILEAEALNRVAAATRAFESMAEDDDAGLEPPGQEIGLRLGVHHSASRMRRSSSSI